MRLIRLVSVLLGSAFALIYIMVQTAPLPTLSVQPGSITFLAELAAPAIQTRTLHIGNAAAGTTLTWTIAISPSIEVHPIVTPITGTNDATLIVQIDTTSLGAAGIYSASLFITAVPKATLGSPTIVPIRVIAMDRLNQVYLPLVTRDYAGLASLRVGLNFVSSAKYPATEVRYGHARAVNTQVNRWPMYWYDIETHAANQPRVYDWAAADYNISADIQHGLSIDAILVGTPPGLDTGGNASITPPRLGDNSDLYRNVRPSSSGDVSSVATPPQGLYEPVFDDHSDLPGPAKAINRDNRWAFFVNAAVNRYKPGGALAQAHGWGNDQGIRYWEIWNEPDLDLFFTGTITDYARLLKVAYLSAKSADPQAQIILGGMVHWQKPNWFGDVLNVISADPLAPTYKYFMDKVAVHSYSWAWQTFGYLYPDRVQLDNHGLNGAGLWLTETGVPVCDDPPGPSCSDPANSKYRATLSEQADYLIQSATYAAWLKAEEFIWFQLFDDCGNGCGGIDAYGLVRNDNTTRPAYTTYKVVADQLTDVQPYWRERRPSWSNPIQEWIAFKRPATSERVVVMWNRFYTTTETALITATASSARLIFPDGTSQTITPANGVYAIALPPATNDKTPTTDGTAPIGGSPRILVEQDPKANQ